MYLEPSFCVKQFCNHRKLWCLNVFNDMLRFECKNVILLRNQSYVLCSILRGQACQSPPTEPFSCLLSQSPSEVWESLWLFLLIFQIEFILSISKLKTGFSIWFKATSHHFTALRKSAGGIDVYFPIRAHPRYFITFPSGGRMEWKLKGGRSPARKQPDYHCEQILIITASSFVTQLEGGERELMWGGR